MMKRIVLICKRWFDIALYTILSTLFFVYLDPIIKKLVFSIQEMEGHWNDWIILPAYLIIPLIFGYFLKLIGGFRFKDFDFIYSFTNPPAWYSSVLVVCIYPVLISFLNKSPYMDFPLFYWITILFLAFFAIGTSVGLICKLFIYLKCLFLRLISEESHSELDNKEPMAVLTRDTEKFIEWLKKEKPIENTEDDFFASDTIARRIVKALPSKSISLIGPYGSGKISILNLTKNKIKEEKSKIIISISAWGYENKKMVSYILENIVNEVSKYTDSLCISFLPLDFQNIFLRNSWGIFDVLKFIFAFENPEGLINKLNDLLKRLNKKLIIFLEDIDRNQDTNVHHQLYSLFNYFTSADYISFVVTYGGSDIVEPLTKITDKTEIVPKLDEFILYDLLTKFRSYCLGYYNDILPPGFDMKTINSRFGLPIDNPSRDYKRLQQIMAYIRHKSKSYKPIDCVIELLRYPRQFKRALANTWGAWQKLHGEINYDDLLVIHSIKTTSCELFHFIVNNIDQFKTFADVNTKVDNRQLYKRVETILETFPESVKELHHNLIQFLFPGWNIQNQDGTEKTSSYRLTELHPQSIASDSTVDYFARAFAEELSEKELSDQTIMHLLQDYNNSKISSEEIIAKSIDSSRYSERIEYFSKLLKPGKILELTSEYFMKIFEAEPHTKLSDHELTGRLWRMSLNNYDSEENHVNWFETQIQIYIFRSMMFSKDIFYFWRYRTQSDADLKRTSIRILNIYIEKIKMLSGNTKKFIEVLNRDKPYIWTLRHIVFGFLSNEEVRVAEEEFFSRWQPWLMSSLLESSRLAPDTVSMYTAPLLYDLEHSIQDVNTDIDDNIENKMKHTWKAKFDELVCNKLFGNDLYKIIRIVSVLKEEDYKDYNDLDEQAKILLDYAVSHSKQWLIDNTSDNNH